MTTLEQLIPHKHNNVLDTVKLAGIDVSGWNYKKDGNLINNPSVNQSKIYRWSFGGINEPTLLFIWHDSLTIDSNNRISFINNLRAYKTALSNIVSGAEKGNKNTARLQYDRAQDFEDSVWSLFKSRKPCRVALLVAHDKNKKNEVDETKSVKFRELDIEEWYVHDFDGHTGNFKIVRAVLAPETIEVDSQFDLILSPEKYPISGAAYFRAIEIKDKVLLRSKGKCEYCGEIAFTTHRNTLFLEVHHVVPLGKGGVDEMWNTVAVCPNHHREAHFGLNRDEILSHFVSYLGSLYPTQINQLNNLAARIVW
jgi:5-methylcytosine-specific restriction enzyme A